MVNTGRPSRDCDRCRQRRVKCDLRRPVCLRCDRLGRACGYRNLDDLKVTFRISTPTSFTKVKSRKPRRSLQLAPEKQVKAFNASTIQSSTSPSPTLEIIEPWDVHIMPLIVYQFSFPSPGGGRIYGALECFSNLLGTLRDGSTLHLACNAVGHAYLANKSPSRSLTAAHRRVYGDALQVLQQTLNDSHSRNQDDTLLSVWMLCFYELVLGTPNSSNGPVNWDIHSRALAALLRSRGRKQFRTKTGRQLFQLAYNYIQIQSFQTGIGPPPEAEEWLQIVQSELDAKDFIYLKSFHYGNEASRICKDAKSVFERTCSTEEKLTVIEEAFQSYYCIKTSLQKASETLVGSNSPDKTTILTTKERKIIPLLGIQNHLDACMVRTETKILDLAIWVSSQPDISNKATAHLAEIQRICEEGLQFSISHIIARLPYLLPPENWAILPSWADTLRLLWPLRCILGAPNAQDVHQIIARSSLWRIAYEIGIMQAIGSFFQDVNTHGI